MDHILLCGRRRSGRSAMIHALLQGVTVPVSGFETITMGTRPDGYHEIYLYPYGIRNLQRCEENHVADCNTRERTVFHERFNSLGVSLLRAEKPGIIVMDEIGFMESGATAFCDAVMNRLDGDLPVLAAVREGIDTAFLSQVRSHKHAHCIQMEPAHFADLYQELRPLVLSWEKQIRRLSCTC